ncbi:hypothetical protein KFK09_004642 [Dendrobium nobile]|uniref:Cytochrome P450 n=1 Tax=Dendrobium nobile TaxID=94219 RepID=A0A8T3C183_DENNO|nr:hypothetical protein KFK09_004642 [Dendrobium nobile]
MESIISLELFLVKPLFLLLLPAFAAAVIWLSIGLKSSLKWKTKGLNLPPGNMGGPLSIWENITFLKSSSCDSHGDFAEQNIQKYGKIYKSYVMGEPTIFSTDIDFQRFILLNDGKLFEQHGPKTLSHILGRTSMLVVNGDLHHHLRSLSLNFVGISKLKTLFLPDINRIVIQLMKDWKENTPFRMKEEACKVTFNVMVKNVLSMNPGVEGAEELRKLYMCFMKGLLALPVYFPGTAYWKALQSRKAILSKLRRVLKERIRKKEAAGIDEFDQSDLLGYVLQNSNLSVEQIGDLLLGLIFGGHETTTSSIVMSVYYLHGCPMALKQLREEHVGIVMSKKARGDQEEGLTWDDYKKMSFTQCVISESLRLGNIIKMIRKRATKDVHFKGYDIPRGWSVILYLVSAHMDSSVYENPEKFDPWRWKRNPQSTAFLPFGQGLRKCPGQELARMETAIFLHHFLLNFEWELVESDHPMGYAIPQFLKGLPLKVQRLPTLN